MSPDPDGVMNIELQIRMAQDALRRLGYDPQLFDIRHEFDSTLHYDVNWGIFKKKFNIRETWELSELERVQLEERTAAAEKERTEAGIRERHPEWAIEFEDQFDLRFHRPPTDDEIIKAFRESLKDPATNEPLVPLYTLKHDTAYSEIPAGYFYFFNPSTKRYYEQKDKRLVPITPDTILRRLRELARPPARPIEAFAPPAPPAPTAPAPVPLPSYEEMLFTERAGLVYYGDMLWRKYEEIKKKRPDYLTLKGTWPVEDAVMAYEKQYGEVRL